MSLLELYYSVVRSSETQGETSTVSQTPEEQSSASTEPQTPGEQSSASIPPQPSEPQSRLEGSLLETSQQSETTSCNIQHLLDNINRMPHLETNCSSPLSNEQDCYVYCDNIEDTDSPENYISSKRSGKISCGQISENQMKNCPEDDGRTNCPNSHNIEEIKCNIDGRQEIFDINLDDGDITGMFITGTTAGIIFYLLIIL